MRPVQLKLAPAISHLTPTIAKRVKDNSRSRAMARRDRPIAWTLPALLVLGSGCGSMAASGVEDSDQTGTQELALGSATPVSSGPIVGFYGKCLSAPGGGVNKTPVVLSKCEGRADQEWTLTAAGEIRGIGGKCLNAEGYTSADGTRLILYDCDGGDNEKWALTPEKWIRGIGNKCLNVKGASHADRTQVVLWPCTSENNEKWQMPTTLYDLTIQVVVTQPESGAGFGYDPAWFAQQVATANTVYRRAGIRLNFSAANDFARLKSDLLYKYLNCSGSVDPDRCEGSHDGAVEHARVVAGNYRGKLVLFIIPNGTASYSSSAPDDLNFVAFGNNGDWTFIVHEVGHYLGLDHPFGNPDDHMSVAEYFARNGNDPRIFDGDGGRTPRGEVADTPPDPTTRAWEEAGQDQCAPLSINGVTFDTDPWNMMIYNPGCAGQHRTVSPDQIGVMLNTLQAPDRVNLFDPNIALQTQGVAIGTTQDGRMQMYATGLEGRVATRWKNGDANSSWTSWGSFGTLTTPGKIAAVQHSNGYNEVFAVSNGQIWKTYQVDDQGAWSPWFAFRTEGGNRDVDTATYSDTRRMLWTVRDGQVYTQPKLTTDPFSGWTEPAAFLDANVTNLAVATVPNAAGRLQVFEVIGNHLYTRWQTSTDWTWSNRSDFDLAASDVSVGLTTDGRMQVYAIDASSGRVMMRAKTTTAANSSWGGWSSGPGGANFTHLAAGNLEDGRPQLFAIRYGAVWQSYMSGTSFTSWSNF